MEHVSETTGRSDEWAVVGCWLCNESVASIRYYLDRLDPDVCPSCIQRAFWSDR